jgi:hypothetical protein
VAETGTCNHVAALQGGAVTWMRGMRSRATLRVAVKICPVELVAVATKSYVALGREDTSSDPIQAG